MDKIEETINWIVKKHSKALALDIKKAFDIEKTSDLMESSKLIEDPIIKANKKAQTISQETYNPVKALTVKQEIDAELKNI